MANNIKVNTPAAPRSGQIVTFPAPCNCDEVTDGLIINGETYTVCDAMGECVTGKGGAWCAGAQISVVLDCENKKAFIQNAAVPEMTIENVTGLQDALNTNATAIQNHTNNKSNPHGVTAAQIGAVSAETHLWKASVLDVCGYVLADALSTFGYTTTVTFKYSAKIASDGVKLSLVNPSSQVVASTTYTKATVIAGKFVLIDTKIYYVPSDGVTTTSSKRTVNCYEVTATYTPREDLGTVTSTDPNAYPQDASQDGVYYEYVGKFEDMVVNHGARICTGSYEGTGTYGEDNPMSIVFPFVPKFVMIGSYSGNEAMFNLTKLRSGAYVSYGYHRCSVSNTSGQFYLDDAQYATINGKTLSFYSTVAVESQINISGEHYDWFAIG